MHKEYTINALIEGNSALKQALKKLRDLRVGSKNIDYLSHLDSEEKSVRIVKYHKGHLCAFYGFLFGAALGLLILFLNQIEVQFALLEAHPQIIIENIWIYLASGGAAGMLSGYVIGHQLVQYLITHDKTTGSPKFTHLLVVDVSNSKKDKVIEALTPYAKSVDCLDNHTEVELGLQGAH